MGVVYRVVPRQDFDIPHDTFLQLASEVEIFAGVLYEVRVQKHPQGQLQLYIATSAL